MVTAACDESLCRWSGCAASSLAYNTPASPSQQRTPRCRAGFSSVALQRFDRVEAMTYASVLPDEPRGSYQRAKLRNTRTQRVFPLQNDVCSHGRLSHHRLENHPA
jgi:hypothetical protein